MKIQTDLNKEIWQTLKKKIAENELKMKALNQVIAGAEKIKHHKQITKKIEAETKSETASTYLDNQYTTNLKVYLRERVYNNSKPDANGVSIANYYESCQENIYFKDYQELIDNAKARFEALGENIILLIGELQKIEEAVNEAEAITKSIDNYNNKYSYQLKEAIKKAYWIKFN
jgi:hypothetical protein